MFAEQLNTAIANTSLNTLDHLTRTIWQGHARLRPDALAGCRRSRPSLLTSEQGARQPDRL